MDSWASSACYPQRTFYPLIDIFINKIYRVIIADKKFYPLSDGPSMRDHRITKSCFRICSTLQSRSQAPLHLCALRAIANRTEGTFELLRYTFGGYRPSKTAHLARSRDRMTVEVRNLSRSGWYFTDGSAPAGTGTSKPPSYATQTRTSVNTRLQ